MDRRLYITGIACLLAGAIIGHLATRQFLKMPMTPSSAKTTLVESPTKEFAKGVIVSRVPFDDGVELQEAVEYLRSCARTRMDIDGLPKPYRLNFVVVDPTHVAKPIRLGLRDIRLDQLCERIA